MKRLIMIFVIFVFPMFFIINIAEAAEVKTASTPAVKSNVDQTSEKAASAAKDTTPASKDAAPAAKDAAPAAKDAAPAAKDAAPAAKSAAPAAKGTAPALAIEHVHEVNLDTIDIVGSGNWLEKRIWYEKAQESFDEVLQLVHKTIDTRIQFSTEVNAIGNKIDAFYEAVDFDKGQLDDKFKEILVSLEVEQKLKGDLSEKERNLKVTVKQELPLIDDLGKNIKSIGDLDVKMDQVLTQAFKTIDECRDLESKAWSMFTDISKEIDDKKARNLYYEINNCKQNIDQKSNYLKTSLLPYLHNVIVAKIESNTTKIKSSIDDLKKKGINLDEIMKSTQESDLTALQDREKESNELAVEKALTLEHEKELQDKAAEVKEEAVKYKKTWSYALYNYYEIIKNNLIVFANLVGLAKVFDSIESYKYPVALYIHQEWLHVKSFIYNSFEQFLFYFYNKPDVETKIIHGSDTVSDKQEKNHDNSQLDSENSKKSADIDTDLNNEDTSLNSSDHINKTKQSS